MSEGETEKFIGNFCHHLNSVQGGDTSSGNEAAGKFKHLVVNGFDDVLGEIPYQHIAALGHLGSGCEWQCWETRAKVDFIRTVDTESEHQALLGRDLNRITLKDSYKSMRQCRRWWGNY